MTLSKNAEYLLKSRYCKPGETPDGVLKRVSKFLAEGDEKFEEQLYGLMVNGVFFPNSPCLFNAGTESGSLHACFTLAVEDNLDSILAGMAHMAKIFKSGGGAGINFSRLREKNAPLKGGGTSSGPISFMGDYNNLVETVKQGGTRRGALMGVMNYDHPDIFDFIRVKLTGKLQNFNLSIMVNDDFMVYNDTDKKIDLVSPIGGKAKKVKAKDIFDIACFAAWCNGDPSFLFYDRINRDNPLWPEIKIDVVNPCSEVALPPYSACCLGSINLSKFVKKDSFNFENFGETCKLAMRALTQMNKLGTYPLIDIETSMMKYNPVGVGVMGFADTLIKLGIKYDSQECLDFIDKVGKVYQKETDNYEKDIFRFYRRIIAPTGSLSILADCSSSIEPIFDLVFERRLAVGVIEETRDLYQSEFVRTAHQVPPEWHVKVLARWQKYVNGGVSKTVNLPHDASVDDIRTIYKMAWKMNCKGITVYRDGCRDDQVLVSKPYLGKCSDDSCTL